MDLCSNKEVSFNRITSPPQCQMESRKKGILSSVETTFQSDKYHELNDGFNEFINWINDCPQFNSSGYLPELNTANYERYVYPIQDQKFKSELSKYKSLVANFKI